MARRRGTPPSDNFYHYVDEDVYSQQRMNQLNEMMNRRAEEDRRRQEMERERLRHSTSFAMRDDFGPRGPRFEARMQFEVEDLMRATHQSIVQVTVETLSKEVVKLASEKIANKFVDQLAARMERELLIGVKELGDELSRSMEECGAKDDGLPQGFEGHERFPRLT